MCHGKVKNGRGAPERLESENGGGGGGGGGGALDRVDSSGKLRVSRADL